MKKLLKPINFNNVRYNFSNGTSDNYQRPIPLVNHKKGFTFNNFTLIYLLPGKGTGILVTSIYFMAFYGKEYGLAAALGVITFCVIGPFLALQFILSGVLKEEVLQE